MRTWKDYISTLSSYDRTKMLHAILEHMMEDEYNSELGYREGEPSMYIEECLYWKSCGESLLE